MSDARQAIAVARDAGAEEIAASLLREAEMLVDSASAKLEERLYQPARRDAIAARRRALDALAMARARSAELLPSRPPTRR